MEHLLDDVSELVEFWTLLDEDRAVLEGRRGATAIGQRRQACGCSGRRRAGLAHQDQGPAHKRLKHAEPCVRNDCAGQLMTGGDTCLNMALTC